MMRKREEEDDDEKVDRMCGMMHLFVRHDSCRI